ncbi:hypothetical protein V8094_004565 [Vibrio parahaemolyticus]|uniref:hypothetical protein n=1 Tax=Vibrio parahaemolyticus TaxID=670 RepID=UPI00111EF5F0|nr:hypothetical protein [Vibrio parahaemolyticus]TOQ19880.1 hypothetical protein CGH00_21005 [Vibrio parahaemolyticus]
MDVSFVFSHALVFLIGALSLYFTAYTKAKGANKALKEDIESLENLKQQIVAKHTNELESVKKQHQLDIEKRKFKYEDKRAQFSKYFRLIDEFNSKCNSVFVERFPQMNQRLLAGQISGCQETANKSLLEFNYEIMQLFNELNEEQIKVNTESNSIRLIASPEVDALLDRLSEKIKQSYEDSVAMLKFMGTPEFILDKSLVQPLQEKLVLSGAQVLKAREALKQQMKFELDEI